MSTCVLLILSYLCTKMNSKFTERLCFISVFQFIFWKTDLLNQSILGITILLHLSVFVRVCRYICIWVKTRGQLLVLLLRSHPQFSLDRVSKLSRLPIRLVWPADETPKIYLAPPSFQSWNNKHAPIFFICVRWIGFRSFSLHSKPCTDWAISLTFCKSSPWPLHTTSSLLPLLFFFVRAYMQLYYVLYNAVFSGIVSGRCHQKTGLRG